MSVLVTSEAIHPVSLFQEFIEVNPRAAVATFTGHVREYGESDGVHTLELEAYPEMAYSRLNELGREAAERFDLHAWQVVHRYGGLTLEEPIVWVATASDHRAAAFAACEFLMDTLKTDAPFWKREHYAGSASWVKVQDSDVERKTRWERESGKT